MMLPLQIAFGIILVPFVLLFAYLAFCIVFGPIIWACRLMFNNPAAALAICLGAAIIWSLITP